MSGGQWAKGERSARADAMFKRLREVAAAERIMTNERVLAALEKHGALSVEQLVWKTELAKSAVQNAIDRLRRDGEVKRLDERRRVGQRGMTQRQLAQACRSSKYTISCIENDQRNLQAFLFMEIGRVLSVSLDWLAFGKSEAA